jgi:hypothetical protein
MLMPLLFTSYDSYLQLLKSFEEAVNSMSGDYEELDLKKFKNSSKNEKHRFCEAVKVNMANSREKSFNDTISSTLSLVTVLCKDFFVNVNIHKELIDCDNVHDP